MSGKRAGVVRYQVTVRLTSGDVRRWAGDGQADVFRFIRFMGRVIRIIGCRQASGGLHGGDGATSGPSFVVRRRARNTAGSGFRHPMQEETRSCVRAPLSPAGQGRPVCEACDERLKASCPPESVLCEPLWQRRQMW